MIGTSGVVVGPTTTTTTAWATAGTRAGATAGTVVGTATIETVTGTSVAAHGTEAGEKLSSGFLPNENLSDLGHIAAALSAQTTIRRDGPAIATPARRRSTSIRRERPWRLGRTL